jgi:hypothetical protein
MVDKQYQWVYYVFFNHEDTKMNISELKLLVKSNLVSKIKVSDSEITMFDVGDGTIVRNIGPYLKYTDRRRQNEVIRPQYDMPAYILDIYKMGFRGILELDKYMGLWAKNTLISGEELYALVEYDQVSRVYVVAAKRGMFCVAASGGEGESKWMVAVKDPHCAKPRQFVSEITAQRWIDRQAFKLNQDEF